MLKCDINIKQGDTIDFHSLPISSTFVVDTCGYEWIGMKVKSGAEDETGYYYILDLSDEMGRLYEDVDRYDIVRLIDLKVVEDKGDE